MLASRINNNLPGDLNLAVPQRSAQTAPAQTDATAVQGTRAAEGGADAVKAVNPPSRTELEQAVKALNQFTQPLTQGLRFSLDDDSGRTIVKVVDTKTQEILRQIPSEEALAIARSIGKMQGTLIQDKA